MAPAVKDRKSGRFTKKSIAQWKENISTCQKQIWTDVRAKRRTRKAMLCTSGNITSAMRRVTELQQLAQDLWCYNCNFQLSLRDYVPGSERKYGLASKIDVKCNCGIIYPVHTGKRQWNEAKHHYVYDMNCKMSLGCIDSSLGADGLNTFLTTLNVPATSKALVKRHERLIGPSIESIANESCAANIELEKRLTEETNSSNSANGEICMSMTSQLSSPDSPDKNSHEGRQNFSPAVSSTPAFASPCASQQLPSLLGAQVTQKRKSSDSISDTPRKVRLIGSFDTGWQKRGTGRSYNSKSGHAALIGYHSGGIMAYGVKSLACALCAKGHPKSDHDCRKNHSGSAKAMEPQLAVELTARNPQLEAANCVIGTLIGDDDSTSIQSVRRESEVSVDKWLDLNHVRKGFATSLFALKVSDNVRAYLCKAFGYAIATNKGDPSAVKAAILNIEKHAYGEHSDCGAWCKYAEDPENYKHRGLPKGEPLTSRELRGHLATILGRYAANAEKIAPCGSSQANESFNNLVASKNPKYKFNAGSEALPFRVAAAVCQKNLGTSYVLNVNNSVGVSPGDETKKFRSIRDKYRSKRALYQKTREYKLKRSAWKKNRSSKDSAAERSEGITYSKNCELNGIADLVDDPEVMTAREISSDSRPVYFDLETTGFSKYNCEITQIAAKAQDRSFSAYIVPEKRIPPVVTAITGLSSCGGELFMNGKKLNTTPHRLAMANFLSFLKEMSPCFLVAHNGMKFDAPIILRHLRSVSLLEEFTQVCEGFTDTLHVFQDKLPKRKSYKQTSLAQDYQISTTNSHNAVADVAILESLVQKIGVTRLDLIRHIKSVPCIIQQEDGLATKKIIAPSLKALQPTVSANMVGKIAAAGISLEHLKATVQSGGIESLTFLLAQDVDGNPKVTKMKAKIEEIFTAVKGLLDNNVIM